jgi:hypothetical protein
MRAFAAANDASICVEVSAPVRFNVPSFIKSFINASIHSPLPPLRV